MKRRYWKLFADSYPDIIGVNERHLSFKCLRSSAQDPGTLTVILKSVQFTQNKDNLRILDLSGTMFGTENMEITAVTGSRSPLRFCFLTFNSTFILSFINV